MFTIKLFRTVESEITSDGNPLQETIEAKDYTILHGDKGVEISIQDRIIFLDHNNYEKAIIENSAGKTTDIIYAYTNELQAEKNDEIVIKKRI